MSDDVADEIRRRMTTIRTALHANVDTIVDTARQTIDWRYQVKRHPWACAAAAAAIGFLVVPRGARKVQLDGNIGAAIADQLKTLEKKKHVSVMRTLWSSLVFPLAVRAAQKGAVSYLESKRHKPEQDEDVAMPTSAGRPPRPR